jgi:hypothetical protein
MKRLKLFGFLCGIILFTAFSCEKKENDFPYGTCIKGMVVGYEQCYSNVLIQVDDYNVGNNVTVPVLNDLDQVIDYIVYDNVIKAHAGQIPDGPIYFVARKYNPDTDDITVLCPLNIIPYAVPIVVITEYSQIQCP